MATKSIFKDVVIKDKKLAKDFIDALSNPDLARYKPADTIIPHTELRGEEVKTFFGRSEND